MDGVTSIEVYGYATPASTVAVTSVSLDKTTATLTAGGSTETLTATVAPDNATDKAVTWTSSNESVATVANGVVTPVAAGTATITAKAGDKTATCAVTVNAAKTAGSISYETASVSKTTADAAFTNPLTKTGDGAVAYESSAASVATVNASTGEVTIVGAGTATITATVTDSDTYSYATKTASYTLTVTAAATYETPNITQADCTFSPTNGTSTLSNANITTSMEYSADNGTTWTDVTSAGSIASLAAGTVQIRV